MSEDTNIPSTEATTSGVKKYFGAFTEGLYTGFRFLIPEFSKVSAAVEAYGEDNVLRYLNQGLKHSITIKAKKSLPDFSDPASADAQKFLGELKTRCPDGIVFGEEELNNWRPFDRDYSPATLTKMIKAAKADGKDDEAKRLASILIEKLGV